jgi:lipopolysaccharide assembly outer membrane protein LptD (OstA)
METKLYSISISLYSDDLYPDDYKDGQENTYSMTEEQYKKFNKLKFTCSSDIHEWCVENLDDDNISFA